MPYHVELADRVRELLCRRPGIREQAMFGGLGFLCDGNMAVGVWRDWLLLRLGTELADQALKLEGFKIFDITGRPMKGWVMVDVEMLDDDELLEVWVNRAWEFAAALPTEDDD